MMIMDIVIIFKMTVSLIIMMMIMIVMKLYS